MRRRRFRFVAAAAALVLIFATVGGYCWLNRDVDPVIVLPDLADDWRLLSFEARSFNQEARGQVEHWTTAGNVTVSEHRVQSEVQPSATAANGHAIHTELSSMTLRVRPEMIRNRP